MDERTRMVMEWAKRQPKAYEDLLTNKGRLLYLQHREYDYIIERLEARLRCIMIKHGLS